MEISSPPSRATTIDWVSLFTAWSPSQSPSPEQQADDCPDDDGNPKVSGANRTANLRPNTPACMAASLTSTAGPTVRNTSLPTTGMVENEAATNASASEHNARMNARPAIRAMDRNNDDPMPSMMCAGTIVLNVAAAAAPITRNPAAWVKSPRTVDRNTRHPDCPSAATGTRGFIHSGRPIRSQVQPTMTAVSSPAASLAQTIIGSLVNATAVAISTIGLIAGADSMNASDADGRTPRSISRLEIGTDPHSHPGSAAPHTVATGTASAALLGMILANTRAGTNAAIAPDTTTPSTRNGVACTQMATNTVDQLCMTGWLSQLASGPRSTMASSSTAPKSSSEPGR